MKLIKFGVFAFGLFASTIAFSQENIKERAKLESEKLSKELSLDERQKNLITELNLATAFKNEEIDLDKTLTNDQKKEKITINENRKIEQLKEILTAEQKVKFNKIEY